MSVLRQPPAQLHHHHAEHLTLPHQDRHSPYHLPQFTGLSPHQTHYHQEDPQLEHLEDHQTHLQIVPLGCPYHQKHRRQQL